MQQKNRIRSTDRMGSKRIPRESKRSQREPRVFLSKIQTEGKNFRTGEVQSEHFIAGKVPLADHTNYNAYFVLFIIPLTPL